MAVLTELSIAAQVSVRGEPPVAQNTTAEIDGKQVVWLGPDEWLAIGASEADYPDASAAVEVSANRVVLVLEGDDAADVLAQGCSLDLHRSVFGPGTCAQTSLARAQVILVRPDDERFLILVRPSFAPYLRTWLEDAIHANDQPVQL
jgi:sarcosine oxidase subunit gamma